MKHWGKNYRRNYERYHNCCLLNYIDIHHIDGNHNNNHPENLQAVTLQEHYDIHKSQNDHYACFMISIRMAIKPEDWKEMARINGAKSGTLELRSQWGKIGGKKCAEEKIGFHSLSKERKIEISSSGGIKAAELGLGFKLGHASTAGKVGGKKGGAYAKENRTGIFALTSEQNKQRHFNSVVTKMINNGKASAWPREGK